MIWGRRKKRNHKRSYYEKEYHINTPHCYCIEYCEGDKKMIVDLDFREPFFELSKDIIKHWEPPYQDIEIGDDDKKRILLNIREYLLNITIPSRIIMDDLDE